MKKKAYAMVAVMVLALLWPGWGLCQEEPSSMPRVIGLQKRLRHQKEKQLIAEMKAELQLRQAMGYTPSQLEQWQKGQNAKFSREMKKALQERPR